MIARHATVNSCGADECVQCELEIEQHGIEMKLLNQIQIKRDNIIREPYEALFLEETHW